MEWSRRVGMGSFWVSRFLGFWVSGFWVREVRNVRNVREVQSLFAFTFGNNRL